MIELRHTNFRPELLLARTEGINAVGYLWGPVQAGVPHIPCILWTMGTTFSALSNYEEGIVR